MCTLHESQYTFLITFRSVLLTIRNVSDRCRENQNTHFIFNNIFSKIVPFLRQRVKILYSLAGYRRQYGECALRAGHLRLQTHIHNT